MSITDNIKKIFRKINYKENKENIKLSIVTIFILTIVLIISPPAKELDFLGKPAETNFISEATQDPCVNKAMTEIIKRGNIIINIDVKTAQMDCEDINNVKKDKEEKELLYMSQKNAIKGIIKE